MTSFEDLIKQDIAEKPTVAQTEKSELIAEQASLKTAQTTDDFGQVLIDKGNSPFETAKSKRVVLNPNQNSLQGYLKQTKLAKDHQQALKLYRAFKSFCAKNKINPKTITGQ